MPGSRLGLLSHFYDLLYRSWEKPLTQRRLGLFLFWIYISALLAVEIERLGLWPKALPAPPQSHFYSIELAFNLILAMEVVSLIFVIPASLSRSMAKQFEILTLILLRNAFKELSNFPEPINIGFENWLAVAEIAVSGAGALAVFVCLGFYRGMIRPQHFLTNPEKRERYVLCKKILALFLLALFLGIAGRDLTLEYQGIATHFFETIYTVLIFADIAMVLIAQCYMPCYYAIFRNSGFVIGTLLMRLALSAPPLLCPAIALFAALFVLALNWSSNYFTPITVN